MLVALTVQQQRISELKKRLKVSDAKKALSENEERLAKVKKVL